MTKEILHQYVNGNISTVLYTDGTLEREWEGEANPEFPSSMDVKITNYCEPTEDNPICAYCHEMSSPKGLHGDLGKLSKHDNQSKAY